jgi:hypothetical protein
MELVTLLTHVHTSCQLGSLTEWVSSPSYETILRGDPNEAGIIKQAVKGMVQSLIPHSSK